MAGVKHARSDSGGNAAFQAHNLLSTFESFRIEFDEHHDRRERVIKASRDITALSKKIIFSLQRVRTLGQPIPSQIVNAIEPHKIQIQSLFSTISPDLQDTNAHRYQRQISSGIQEYIEAVSFQQYLERQNIITHGEVQSLIPGNVLLTESDYLLGLFDMVGELMRFAITAMATSGALPRSEDQSRTTREKIQIESDSESDALVDMRALRMCFESLDLQGSGMKSDVGKKMEVMQQCVEKVEMSVYGLKIRGQERPKGWVPDLTTDDKREAIESY